MPTATDIARRARLALLLAPALLSACYVVPLGYRPAHGPYEYRHHPDRDDHHRERRHHRHHRDWRSEQAPDTALAQAPQAPDAGAASAAPGAADAAPAYIDASSIAR